MENKRYNTITINCECGHIFVVKMIGEGKFNCPFCQKKYERKYVGNGKYEFV